MKLDDGYRELASQSEGYVRAERGGLRIVKREAAFCRTTSLRTAALAGSLRSSRAAGAAAEAEAVEAEVEGAPQRHRRRTAHRSRMPESTSPRVSETSSSSTEPARAIRTETR